MANRPATRAVQYNATGVMLQMMRQSLKQPSYFDVVIKGPNEDAYYCLKSVLCAYSRVFQTMFSHEMEEGIRSEVHIRETDPRALEQMVLFMHTWQCEIDGNYVIPLSALADQYEVTVLGDLCRKFERQHLVFDTETCCKYMKHALVYGRRDLVLVAQEVLIKNMETFANSKEFLELPFDSPTLVGMANFAHEQIGKSLSQMDYFGVVKGLVAWMEHHIEDKEQGDWNAADLFEELKINVLSPQQIQQLCTSELVKKSPQMSLCIVNALASQHQPSMTMPVLFEKLSLWHK